MANFLVVLVIHRSRLGMRSWKKNISCHWEVFSNLNCLIKYIVKLIATATAGIYMVTS